MPPTFERTSGCYVVFHSSFTSQLTFEIALAFTSIPFHSLFLSLSLSLFSFVPSLPADLSFRASVYILEELIFHYIFTISMDDIPLFGNSYFERFFFSFLRKELKFRREHPNRHRGFTGDTCLENETIISDVSLNVERSDVPLEYL